MGEIFRALGALLERPTPEKLLIARSLEIDPLPSMAEHTEAIAFSFYPYASVYLGREGMIGGDARDRIAGFFRALRLEVPHEPDHVAVLLATYATLAEQRHEAARHAQRVLFFEHIVSFLPAYAAALARLGGFYERWATLMLAALEGETSNLAAPETRPACFEDTRAAADVESLLAPARSGMILARRDLVRIANAIGLGVRAGERRYALRSMLSQDPSPVLEALSREAVFWTERHLADKWNPFAHLWAERAAHTSRDLIREAKEAHHAFAL